MSYLSPYSQDSTSNISRVPKPTASPLQFAFSLKSARSASVFDISHSSSRAASSNTLGSPNSSYTYSSWPSSSVNASAYICGDDLMGEESALDSDDDSYLSEPPPPPRSAEVWLARPLLPPVVETRSRKCSFGPGKKRASRRSETRVKVKA